MKKYWKNWKKRCEGVELITIPQEELFYKIKEIKGKEAKEITKTWINGAEEIKDTNETEILKSAKVYLAMKELIGHCECPLNPYGDEKKCSYIIKNLPHWRKNEGGACIQVNLLLNETVTAVRISIYDKKISLFTGKTTSGKEIFNKWDNLACRTKVAIKTDTEMLLKNIDWQTFGVHRVIFYGDLMRKVA